MTIAIKPTATTATIEHNDSTILTVDSSGNITPSNDLYPKVPLFHARRGTSDQTLSAATFTKIQYNSELIDTTDDYDNSTNYRYTPSVAGYYKFTVGVYTYLSDRLIIGIYKNGSSSRWVMDTENTSNGFQRLNGSAIIQANGTTDYFEAYVYMTSSTAVRTDSGSLFEAHLVSV